MNGLSFGNIFVIFLMVSLISTSLVAQLVKNLPLRQESQVQSLGQKDRREKDTATYSSILAWSIPRPGYSPWGGKESDMTG